MLLDFQGQALNPAAEGLLSDVGPALSRWGGMEGLPAEELWSALRGGAGPLSFELRGPLGPSGRWYRARAVKHEEGFLLWLFDFTDAQTERRLLREQLAHEREELAHERGERAREAHLRLALETARMVTWEWDEGRGSFRLSANAPAFFGSPPEGLGESLPRLLERVHPDDREDIDEAFARIRRARGPHAFTFRSQWPDGSMHSYEVVGRTFHEEGQPTRVMGVAMDCTERERSQRELREAEERYRLAAQATNDVLWDWNPTTGHIHWGESSREVFGREPEDMGDFDTWAERIHPDDREQVVKSIYQVAESKQDTWSSEYRFLCKDGAYRDVLDRGRVARGARGETLRMIGSMMDITERKRAVERMREEALFRDRFIGILGHDLRNPLNAILLSARELRRRGLPDHPDAARAAASRRARCAWAT